MTTRASAKGCGTVWAPNGPRDGRQPDLAEVKHRLLMAQVLEAVRALEEGVLTDIREGDVGAILGWGFAPWSGGPFSWLDIIGRGAAVEMCDGLEAAYGPRFQATQSLRDMAARGASFYDGVSPPPPDARRTRHRPRRP